MTSKNPLLAARLYAAKNSLNTFDPASFRPILDNDDQAQTMLMAMSCYPHIEFDLDVADRTVRVHHMFRPILVHGLTDKHCEPQFHRGDDGCHIAYIEGNWQSGRYSAPYSVVIEYGGTDWFEALVTEAHKHGYVRIVEAIENEYQRRIDKAATPSSAENISTANFDAATGIE